MKESDVQQSASIPRKAPINSPKLSSGPVGGYPRTEALWSEFLGVSITNFMDPDRNGTKLTLSLSLLSNPVLPEQVFDDYAKDVGLLIRDLDPVVNKGGSLDASGRCMWDQGYLAFKVNQETLEWHVSWMDCNGNSLKREDVQLYDKYNNNHKEAFNAVIENFDRKQNQRIMAYN
ncbi:hypothetical protein J7337_008758 [Fusarium musae]|uniref:Uncharacterized protein n=1 Tax=Fusarium musae TaxID=1042133 RepID=A0A9P8DE77_9HYPO|nr:hypothetical protein J7337_008758 [Fusarium musae]KAG9500283.1 hypothetical protein J7337_008758 [Fusarium musae]